MVKEARVFARPRNNGIAPDVGEFGDVGPDCENAGCEADRFAEVSDAYD